MLTRPFRPPQSKRPAENWSKSPQTGPDGPSAAKKRRISDDFTSNSIEILDSSKTPSELEITLIRPASIDDKGPSADEVGTEAYYNVLWRNFKVKKYKTWDGDGLLSVVNGHATLQNLEGKQMGRIKCTTPLLPDAILSIGGKEVQVESVIPKVDFVSGRSFLGTIGKPTMKDLDESLRTDIKFNTKLEDESVKERDLEKPMITVPPSSRATIHAFKNPLKEATILPMSKTGTPVPRHDPHLPGALVMKRPAIELKDKQIVDVVVDPLLSQSLRQHQRIGVQFLYECVMGMRPFSGEGAILADEMGLGKTLQVITLLWTLLKQNPIHGAQPVIRKALIVCPVTLVKNWKKEFRKWLGLERVGVFVLEDKGTKLTDFTMGKSYNIMIIGYEKLRTIHNDLQKGSGIDIVIADEGHRLKTAQNKSAQAIKSLSTSRKIILSGTPLQNDLSEFYFMVDFVNPGLLGKVNTFKREFETPILKGRQPDASSNDIAKGEGRSEELASLTSLFILRRTSEVLAKYLPEKTEYILFCRPTSAQASVYRTLLSSSLFSAVLNTPEASLQLIGILKKLCNSPSLLRKKETDENYHSSLISSLLSSVPPGLLKSPGASGKLQVLDSLLYHLHNITNEKVVIVSHYTATLDIIEGLLSALGYSFLRLDGSTSQSKRQDLVDKFNRTDSRTYFAFLLSAKSGGLGLNLTGASRLVLFDNDWNPSTDLQAMARIHRDGQKQPCRIYRLLTKGVLDEKIYQRQLTKLSLADSVVDNKTSASNFTKEELRDLFRLDEGDACQTHELLGCECGGNGSKIKPEELLDADESQEDCEKDDTKGDNKCANQPESLDFGSPTEVQRAVEEAAPEGKRMSSKGRTQAALSSYQHFSTTKLIEILTSNRYCEDARNDGSASEPKQLPKELDNHVVLQDNVLRSILTDTEERVSFIFAKSFS